MHVIYIYHIPFSIYFRSLLQQSLLPPPRVALQLPLRPAAGPGGGSLPRCEGKDDLRIVCGRAGS